MEYLLIALGIAGLSFGSNYLVNLATALGAKFRINAGFLGLVVLGFGTSLPELQTSVQSTLQGYLPLAYGNIIGSNIFNVLFILSASALIAKLIVKKIYPTDIYYLVFSNLVFAVFLLTTGIVTITALILIAIFIKSIMASYKVHKLEYINAPEDAEHKVVSISSLKIAIFAIVGFAGLFIGAHLLISNSIIIAANLGISEKIIGITIVAIGTSLPELATSLAASFKKQNDIAIYNIIGSNIFNISIIAGVSGLIKPFTQGYIFKFDMIFFMLALLSLTFITLKYKNKAVDKKLSIFMLLSFILYIFLLFYN